jgi:chromosome partitioning protein
MKATVNKTVNENRLPISTKDNVSVTCPKCKKQYTVEKSRISRYSKLVAKCRLCGHRFPMLYTVKDATAIQQIDQQQASEVQRTARSIGVSLSKGGVGKTTTSINLGAGLALAGFRVLLVDTDTQGQDSYALGVKPKAGLKEFLMDDADPEDAIVKARENLWLMAGGKSLAGVKRLIDQKEFGGELTLSEALSPLESQYDFVIIDTSPGWDPLTVNVLFYVKEILVPVSLEVMSLQGLLEFLRSVSAIQRYRKEVSLRYIVPTFLDSRVSSPAKILKKLNQLYGEYVCTPIRYNASFTDAPAFGQTIYEFAPGSFGTEDYRELVRRVANNDRLLR